MFVAAAASQRKTIGIIGAAIAGPTLALQILSNPTLRSAFRPVLLDQTPAPGSHSDGNRAGATVGLSANGLRPLYDLGLKDAVRNAGSECGAISTLKSGLDGRYELWKKDRKAMWSEDMHSGVMYYERQALQAVLVDKVRQLGGEVMWEKKAAGFEVLGEQTRVNFEDGERMDVDLLVGADGSYSGVRRFILEQKDTATAGERWLPDFMGITGLYGISKPVRSERATAEHRDSHLIVLDRGFIATGPIPDGKIRWDLLLPEAQPPAASEINQEVKPEAGGEAWQARIVPGPYPPSSTIDLLRMHKGVYHPYSGSFGALLDTATRIIRTPMRQRVWKADEIHWGSNVLIGDAARTMLPTSGQGTGFAIEDATVLASQLLRSIESGEGDLRKALAEYARLRQKRSTKMATVAASAGKISVGDTALWRALRLGALKWMPKMLSER